MLPDLSLVWVIVFVLLLTVLMDRLLLRPLTRVMHEREQAIRAARELAESSRQRAQAATDEFEARTRAARADLYHQMDEKRRAALLMRAELVAETRHEIEQSTTEATAKIRAQANAARASLDGEADHLASSIVERVLGRKAS